MDTLFLFTKHLNDTGCLCLKIDDDGAVIAPPATRDFAEIKTLQKNAKTLVIEASSHASLIELELPWLPERKARAAIPYALEDKLAQSVDELHFAFDRPRYQNNRYLVIVISKQRMRYLMHMLNEQGIEFASLTLDWFALEFQELCLSEDTLLVNAENFRGALSGELVNFYLKDHPEQQPLLFTDSQIPIESSLPKSQESSHTWIAQKIRKLPFMNLCQGEMQRASKTDLLKKGYQLAAVLFGLWLISLVLVNAINLYLLNKESAKIDDQIAEIYREFFPGAKQVISPKFRIMQLLKNNNTADQNRFWVLLNQLASVMNKDQFAIQQLRYQNNTLSVTIVSADFANLEKLENELKNRQLKVRQTQASTHEQEVVATLELM